MKYLRLMFMEPTFIVRWSLLLIICGIILYQYRTLDFQNSRVAQMVHARQERLRLANLRRDMRPIPKPVEIAAPKPKKHYTLEGSSRQSDTFQALINGKVYTPGDPLDEFVVKTITLDSATLVHRNTGETQVLKFKGLQISQN